MKEQGFELHAAQSWLFLCSSVTFENRNTCFLSVNYSCAVPLPPANKLSLVLLVLTIRISSSKKSSPLLSLSLGCMPSSEFLLSFHTILALTHWS